jgi:hypothetical protein
MSDQVPYRCKTPVVLILFKRADTTARVFEQIRAARPPKLLVVADGARNEAEREACEQTRAIVDGVDWPCEVLRDFSDVNLGCRRRVASGIDWAFRQVEEAIILEDDCLPHLSFFRYCDELLERYRDTANVWTVAGASFLRGAWNGDASYYFSRFATIWGWASWRRAWQHYDAALTTWPAFRDGGGLERLFPDPAVAAHFRAIFEKLRVEGKPNTWDYQWFYSCLAGGGLTAIPRVNLVSNIGFGGEATHTQQDALGLANLPTEELGPIRHPAEVAWDAEGDRIQFDNGTGLERVHRWYEKEQRLGRRFKRRWDAFRRAVGLKK